MREKERLARLHDGGMVEVLRGLETAGPTHVRGLNTATTAILLSELLRTQKRPVVVLAAKDDVLTQTALNLKFFAPRMASDIVVMPEIQAGIYSGVAQNRRQVAGRMLALHKLRNDRPRVVMASFASAARRCIPKDELAAQTMLIRTHETLDLPKFKAKLQELGYAQAQEVDTPGTFAVRGGIVDVFSPAHAVAIRIELFGDEIDEIRSFDVETQKTLEKRGDAIIIPASEIIMSEDNVERAFDTMADWADELEIPSKLLRQNREKLEERVLFWGIQALMPAYYEKTASFLDYLPEDAIVLWLEPDLCLDTVRKARANLDRQYEHALAEQRLVAPPKAHFMLPEDLSNGLCRHKVLYSGLALDIKEAARMKSDRSHVVL